MTLVLTGGTAVGGALLRAEPGWVHRLPGASRPMQAGLGGPPGPGPSTTLVPATLAPPAPVAPVAPPAEVPATTSTLPRHGSGRAPGVIPPSTFLLNLPVESYPYVFERSVTLEGRFEFVYEQFGQPVLAFSPAPGTHTTWRLFTVMLYDRDAPTAEGATRLEALLAQLRVGATTTVEIPVLRDPGGEERFVAFATEQGGLSRDEARAKYERMLLSNREPLLGIGVGSYFMTSAGAVSISPLA